MCTSRLVKSEVSMPKLPMPTQCPVTGEPLEITRLECPASGITIEGRFTPNEFALLAPEHLEFMRLFVKVRGNLKEVERILGVSYPTVRLRFDNMLKSLGYEVEDIRETREDRAAIVSALEKGEITAEEAASKLRALKRR